MPSFSAFGKDAVHDPRLSTLVQIWFGAFGSKHRKVKELLRESPAPLMELFLRFGHEPEDRHRISSQHLGVFLSRLVRAPPIMGFQMTSREMNRQAAYALVDAGDVPSRSLVARPGTSTGQTGTGVQDYRISNGTAPAPVPIPDDVSDANVMEYGLRLAKLDLTDAIRSQDFVRIQEAEERLTMVAAAIDRASWSHSDWHRFFGNKGKLFLR